MIKLLKDLMGILDSKTKYYIYILQLLLILSAFFEVISILMLVPFMGLVSGSISLNDVMNNVVINKIQVFLNLDILNLNEFILFFGIAVLLIFVVSNLFTIFTIYIINLFAQMIGAKLSTLVYSSILQRPYNFFIENNSSILTSNVQFDTERASQLISRLMHTNVDVIMCIFIVTTLVTYNPKIALVLSFGFFVTYFMIYYVLKGRLKRYGALISDQNSLLFKILSESFGSIKDIIVANRSKFFINNYRNSKYTIAHKSAFLQTTALVPKNIIEMGAFIFIISLIIYYSHKTNNSIDTALTTLSIFGLGAYKLLPRFQSIYFNVATVRGHQASFYFVKNFFDDQKNFNEIDGQQQVSSKNNFKNFKTIELKDLSFKHNNNNKLILKDISLSVKSGSSIGIVGGTGAGKSTFINILLGLLNPSQGTLQVDDIEINSQTIRSWQNIISFVPQQIFLMEASLLDNVLFGEKKELFSPTRFKEACTKAELDEVINNLPDKENTIIGQNGIKLSGGQQQRIGIARALYKENNVLFFDESTNSLDGITESKILENIKSNSNITFFIVSHNFATIKNCDLILFFDNGKISKKGTYKDLMNDAKFKFLAEQS